MNERSFIAVSIMRQIAIYPEFCIMSLCS